MSASYPGFVVSTINPSRGLKGKVTTGKSGSQVRAAMVVAQFVVAIVGATVVVTIQEQLHFLNSTDLGYDPQGVVYLGTSEFLRGTNPAFIAELGAIPGVESVSLGSVPIETGIKTDRWSWPGKGEVSPSWIHPMIADYDYLDVYGLRLKDGRWFTRESGADLTDAFVVNEETVRVMGMTDPLGQRIDFSGKPGTIIGVVSDFNYGRLHDPINPVVFMMEQPGHTLPRQPGIRVSSLNSDRTIREIERIWKAHFPDQPFSFSFLTHRLSSFYGSDRMIGTITLVFAALALCISCLGLIGLVMYLAVRKTKEIGIRKSLGADSWDIVRWFSLKFVLWVGLASLIAWPISYLAASRWLENFAYRIDLSPMILISPALAVMIIALVTVSFRILKAALANPVDSLRCE
jgi:hypothetical protein